MKDKLKLVYSYETQEILGVLLVQGRVSFIIACQRKLGA